MLYYLENSTYDDSLSAISRIFKSLQEKWKIICSMRESSSLTSSETERLKAEIRNIPPQIRGRIVTSRGDVLPLSQAKNLNLTNTPILLVYQKGLVVDVYPHVLGSRRFNIVETLQRMLKLGPTEYLQFRGLLEEPLIKILTDFSEILGRGTRFLASEVPVQTGTIDLLMEDESGRIILVEVENYADDFAVGQVSRLATGYSAQSGVPQDSIRKTIVCIDFSSTMPHACRGAGIDLLRLTVEPVM